MGISDFIPKPIDNKLLQNAIFKIVYDRTQTDNQIDKVALDEEESLVKKLDILSKSKTPIEFINHYRGVPIIHHGYIVNTHNNKIIVHTPYIQTMAISYENYTVIESELLDTAIKAELIDINKTNREIELTNFEQLQFSSKKRTLLRVEPNKQFTLVVHKNGKRIESTVIDLSLNSISVVISTKDIDFKVSEELELTFGLELHNNKTVSSIATNERIYTKGKIFKIKQLENNKIDMVMLFELNKPNIKLLQRYIHIREIELIDEFKQLKQQISI